MATFCCDACTTKLRVPDAFIGKRVKCPGCAAVLRVPTPERQPTPLPASQSRSGGMGLDAGLPDATDANGDGDGDDSGMGSSLLDALDQDVASPRKLRNILLKCGACSKVIKVPENRRGATYPCPKCRTQLLIERYPMTEGSGNVDLRATVAEPVDQEPRLDGDGAGGTTMGGTGVLELDDRDATGSGLAYAAGSGVAATAQSQMAQIRQLSDQLATGQISEDVFRERKAEIYAGADGVGRARRSRPTRGRGGRRSPAVSGGMKFLVVAGLLLVGGIWAFVYFGEEGLARVQAYLEPEAVAHGSTSEGSDTAESDGVALDANPDPDTHDPTDAAVGEDAVQVADSGPADDVGPVNAQTGSAPGADAPAPSSGAADAIVVASTSADEGAAIADDPPRGPGSAVRTLDRVVAAGSRPLLDLPRPPLPRDAAPLDQASEAEAGTDAGGDPAPGDSATTPSTELEPVALPEEPEGVLAGWPADFRRGEAPIPADHWLAQQPQTLRLGLFDEPAWVAVLLGEKVTGLDDPAFEAFETQVNLALMTGFAGESRVRFQRGTRPLRLDAGAFTQHQVSLPLQSGRMVRALCGVQQGFAIAYFFDGTSKRWNDFKDQVVGAALIE